MGRTRDKVLDASVVIKWFIDENGSGKAEGYLNDYRDGKFSIIVPTLLFYELGNILLAKKATTSQVIQIMQHLQVLDLTRVDIGYEAFRKIFQNADELAITYYDASYLTLMQKLNCEFITADEKLFQKIRRKFASVSLL